MKGKLFYFIVFIEDSGLVLRLYGLLWIDFNFVIKYNCRNVFYFFLKLFNVEEGFECSGVWIE